MRFLSRSKPIEPLSVANPPTLENDAYRMDDSNLPMKARGLLGTNEGQASRSGPHSNGHTVKSEQHRALGRTPSHEQTGNGRPIRSQEEILSGTNRSHSENVPWSHMQARRQPSHEGTLQTPNSSKRPGVSSSGGASAGQAPHRPWHHPSVESSMNREYNRHSRRPQPPYQQSLPPNSPASQFRRGYPTLQESSSDPALAERQLRSAMKPSKVGHEDAGSKPAKGSKKVDLPSFFSHSRPSGGRLLANENLPRSPPAPHESPKTHSNQHAHSLTSRPEPNGRFQLHGSEPTPSITYTTDSAPRVKVFDADVYDRAKTNVRRPPKGIQNWFDAIDISSDEDEHALKSQPEVQPPAQTRPPVQPQQPHSRRQQRQKAQQTPSEPIELPANEAMPTGPLPSTFSQFHNQQRNHTRTATARKPSIDPVGDNQRAIDQARIRMRQRAQRKNSQASAGIESVPSPAVSVPGDAWPGRLASSRLGSQSVLSLSDSDNEGASSVAPGNDEQANDYAPTAISSNPSRSSTTHRKLHSSQYDPVRKSTSTFQSTGSIPIKFLDDFNRPPVPDIPYSGGYRRSASQQRHDQNQTDDEAEPHRSRRTSRSAHERGDDHSVAADSNSSMPSDAARMMAVSEEEMILLELMRQKRAAMQKNSFSEGYRLALQQEEDQLSQKRDMARLAARRILRKNEGTDSVASSRRGSKSSSIYTADIEQKRRMSTIRKEDVDKALKLERFLSTETPTMDEFPAPPGNLIDSAATSPRHEMDLLLPARTYAPASRKVNVKPVVARREPTVEEDVEGQSEEAHETPMQKPARRTKVARPESTGEEDIEQHHEQLRAFLASSSASEGSGAGAFSPTRSSPIAKERHTMRKGISPAPSPVPEEEATLPTTVFDPQAHNRSGASSKQARHGPNQPSPSPSLKTHSLDHTHQPQHRPDFARPRKPSPSPSHLQDPYAASSHKSAHDSTLYPGPPSSRSDMPRDTSPSLSTSHASPLTPTFPAVPTATPYERLHGQIYGHTVEVNGDSDTGSSTWGYGGQGLGRSHGGGSGPGSRSTSRGRSPGPGKMMLGNATLGGESGGEGNGKDKVRRGGRNGAKAKEVRNVTSAGEDVLAAWAELGGGGMGAERGW